MSETEQIADRIRELIPIEGRSLRFWGEWFGGRPYEGFHTLTKCAIEEDCLRLFFDQGETLLICSPQGISLDETTFRIRTAARVRWEWFYYGRPRVPANLYFIEFEKCGEDVTASTNIDFYAPNFKPSTQHPAVEILSPPG
jgi:hypothetical protein